MTESTILDTILAHKREEVNQRQARRPLLSPVIQARLGEMPASRDFLGALRRPNNGRVALIAEVKKASPSAGIIRTDFAPVQIAQAYASGGADCLSVLTDEHFFHGHDDHLRAVKSAVTLPILRKDFIVDAYQIHEARLLGADAILLIAAALSPTQMADYQALASGLNMTALVEVHTEAEMGIALGAKARLIGINSRDLKTFTTDLTLVERLAAMVPDDVILVAESGIKTPADVAYVRKVGADAILVGETLMRAPDIGAAMRELLG